MAGWLEVVRRELIVGESNTSCNFERFACRPLCIEVVCYICIPRDIFGIDHRVPYWVGLRVNYSLHRSIVVTLYKLTVLIVNTAVRIHLCIGVEVAPW